jgi:hypothetical protein
MADDTARDAVDDGGDAAGHDPGYADGSYWRDLLQPVYGDGRKWMVCTEILAISGAFVQLMADYGAGTTFVLSGSRGTGDLPDPGLAEWAVLDSGGDTIMESIRAFEAAVHDLPAGVLERIDRWDPDRRALVLGSFLDVEGEVAGRPMYGVRPPAWAELEDKTTVQSLWDEAGIATADSAVVAAEAGALRAGAAAVDRGAGTVWVADNRDGWHGGGEYLRWVRDGATADAALEFLQANADVARVMPFLEGIPCAVHGVVLPDAVAVFRPVEMVTLRRPGDAKLLYSGVSTFWQAPAADTAEMREVARRVGSVLRHRVGFRGAFTVDGVLAEDGFLPTELNARPGAGLGFLVGSLEELPFMAVNRAIIAGEDLDYRPAELERAVIAGAAAGPRGGGHVSVSVAVEEVEEVEIVFDGDTCRTAADGETADGTMSLGPGPLGGFLRVTPDPERVSAGPSVAPRAVAAFALSDVLWGTGLVGLEAARPAR